MGRVFQISQGSLSQPPSPGRLGVHKSEAGTEAALEGKWLVPRKTGSLCWFTVCDFAASAGRRLLHRPEVLRLPPFTPPLHARSTHPETGGKSVLSYLKC